MNAEYESERKIFAKAAHRNADRSLQKRRDSVLEECGGEQKSRDKAKVKIMLKRRVAERKERLFFLWRNEDEN